MIECILSMLRVLINDMDTPPQFSDSRLTEIIKAAIFYVLTDLRCCEAVDVPVYEACDDVPSDSLNYPEFVNLVLLRAACLMDLGLARTKVASDGVRAVCGPVSLSVLGNNASFRVLFAEGSCAAYQNLKEDLCLRCPAQSAAGCRQVVSLGIDGWVC